MISRLKFPVLCLIGIATVLVGSTTAGAQKDKEAEQRQEISANGERMKILDFLDAEEISVTAGRKQLDNLRSLLPKIRRKEERARVPGLFTIMEANAHR
jgi:hypothetical protein